MVTSLSASVLYCDDIRVEEGGRLLAVGVYGSDIVLTDYPEGGLRIQAIVRVIGPGDYDIKVIELEHYYNDEIVYRLSLPFPDIEQMVRSHEQELAKFNLIAKSLNRIHPALLVHGYAPVHIKDLQAKGMVSTRVNLGDGFLEAGSIPLIVERAPTTETPETTDDAS